MSTERPIEEREYLFFQQRLISMYETVLVATDGSEAANAAFDHGVELADALGASVHLLAVVETGQNPLRFGPSEVEEIDQKAAALVEEITQTIDRVEIHSEIRRGKPAETVLAYAEEIGADVIIVGQHGTDGLEAAVLGSTTDRLARLTDIPLIIIPHENPVSSQSPD